MEQGLSSPLGLYLRSQQKLSELEQSKASLLRAGAAIPGGGGVGWEEVILEKGKLGGGPTPEVSSADCSPRQIPKPCPFPRSLLSLGIFGEFRLLSHSPIIPQARLLSRKTGFPMSLCLLTVSSDPPRSL